MSIDPNKDYPQGPSPPAPEHRTKDIKLDGKTFKIPLSFRPGEGINASPFESAKLLDLTAPLGNLSGLTYGVEFQLGKWGYIVKKFDHSLEVSPVFTEYYTRTMDEKRKIEGQIKSGFASLSQAVQDFELLNHDVRRYREYMQRFQKISNITKKMEELKKKKNSENIEKIEKELESAQHVIRAMFVDQVDAHTGEGMSMRSIAPRWPTVISDFMELTDKDTEVDGIRIKLDTSRAEAVILKTKNDLFIKWKEFFLETIQERYKYLTRMKLSRKASIDEYRNEIRPLLSRYKAIKEFREDSDTTKFLKTHFFRQDSQAISSSLTEIWAWRPFIVREEPFPASRESWNPITLKEAGFNQVERDILKNNNTNSIPPMPAVPVMDKFIRGFLLQIEATYGVKLTVIDVVDQIKSINKMFEHPERGSPTGPTGPRWEFSPYYVLVKLPLTRTAVKLPSGVSLEDLWIDGFQAWNATQNIIIMKMLEKLAIEKQLEYEIEVLLGEGELKGGIYRKLDEILREEFEFFGSSDDDKKEMKKYSYLPFKEFLVDGEIEEEKEEPKADKEKLKTDFEKFRKSIKTSTSKTSNFMSKMFGLNLMWSYPGPYEKMMFERMTKMMQRGPGEAFTNIDIFLKRGVGVQGV